MNKLRNHLIATGLDFSKPQDLTELREIAGYQIIDDSPIWDYIKEFSYDRQLFLSSVYLLPAPIIVALIEELGTLGNYLLKGGFLPFAMSIGGDLLVVDTIDLSVLWFKKMYFLDGCDEVIINNIEAYPSRDNLFKISIFIGRFSESLLVDLVTGNYSTLFTKLS
jgi:hypothetical protein